MCNNELLSGPKNFDSVLDVVEAQGLALDPNYLTMKLDKDDNDMTTMTWQQQIDNNNLMTTTTTTMMTMMATTTWRDA